jgi:4-hydroxythreonine-4-phosphate dehydrogenase
MGDYNGIGPEIILKTLPKMTEAGTTPVVVGHRNIFEFYANLLDIPLPNDAIITEPEAIEDGKVNFLNLTDLETIKPEPGVFSADAGAAAMQAVETGLNYCVEGHAHGLVTAPISKEAVNKAGWHIPGHTEFLAEKTGSNNFLMILVHEGLRVALVTIHIPVSAVAGKITEDAVLEKIRSLHEALRGDFNIPEPRIAVLGLNPHAGDGGIIGKEEIDIIAPAMVRAEAEGIRADGPHPADAFFGNRRQQKFDGVLAMYHDQGLVPFKALSFGGGVNVTAGLPIVRTSPDHGTAFDIAGTNAAKPNSFSEAVRLAMQLSTNRLQKNNISS